METKKISKWDAAPKSVKTMYELLKTLEAFNTEKLVSFLEDILDDYNELEAKHQSNCGLISQYAENEKNYDLLMEVHMKYIKEYTEQEHMLKEKLDKAQNNIRDLRTTLAENEIATYLDPKAATWGVANIALQKKTEHFNAQLDNLRKKIKDADTRGDIWKRKWKDMNDILATNEDDYNMLEALLESDGYSIEYDGDISDEIIHCLSTFDICRETAPDEVTLQYGRWTLRRPQNFSEAKANGDVAILKKQIRDRDREIVELKKKCDEIKKSCQRINCILNNDEECCF